MANLKRAQIINTNSLLGLIIDSWPFEQEVKIIVGLSGGVDSVVLLHLLHQISRYKQINLAAIHINHGISPNAAAWANLCSTLCANLGIPLIIHNYKVTRTGGESLENNARKVRYTAFLSQEAHPVIALAHHQNDQIETILSQLFRGSDLHNVAAMQYLTTKGTKLFWRPLLNISRTQIETYAKEYGLEFANDESNTDTTYLRNFIRHDILPSLIKWDKNVSTKILNFNQQLQQLLAITDEIAKEDLKNCALPSKAIFLDKFKLFSSNRQQNLLGYFIKQNNLPLPSKRQLTEFIHQAITSKWDRKPKLQLDAKHNLIKNKDKIYIDRLGESQ